MEGYFFFLQNAHFHVVFFFYVALSSCFNLYTSRHHTYIHYYHRYHNMVTSMIMTSMTRCSCLLNAYDNLWQASTTDTAYATLSAWRSSEWLMITKICLIGGYTLRAPGRDKERSHKAYCHWWSQHSEIFHLQVISANLF